MSLVIKTTENKENKLIWMEESILTHKTRYLRSAFLRQKSKNEISQECVKWLIFRVAELELHGVGVQVGLLKVQKELEYFI